MTNKGLREKVKDLQKQLLDLESLCRETLNVNAIYAVQVARIQMERVDAQLARNEKRAKLEPKPGEWIGMSEGGKLYPIEEFCENVQRGLFIEDDGSGYLVSELGGVVRQSRKPAPMDELELKELIEAKVWTHVAWYGK